MSSTKQTQTLNQQIRVAQHRLLKLLVEKIMLEALKDSPRSTGGSKHSASKTLAKRRWK